MRSEIDNPEEVQSSVSGDMDIRSTLTELNKTMQELLLAVRQIGNLEMQILEKMPKAKPVAILPKGESNDR
jgi:hypothetical protein